MTEQELLSLVEEFEDAAVDFGEHRYDKYDPNQKYRLVDMIRIRVKLVTAISKLFGEHEREFEQWWKEYSAFELVDDEDRYFAAIGWNAGCNWLRGQ